MFLLTGVLLFSNVESSWWDLPEERIPAGQQTCLDLTKINAGNVIADMDMVYKLNDAYLENEELLNGSSETIEYGSEFLMENSVWMGNDLFFISVADSEAYMDYECCWIADYNAGSSSMPVYMWSVFTREIISLTASKEEFAEYLERTSKFAKSVREKAEYVRKNFNESEYGGIYYDIEAKEVYAYIMDENRWEELEKEGIQYKKADYSLDDLYEKLREIWQYREELEINYIETNAITNRLDIYTANADRLEEWLLESEIYCCTAKEECVIYPGNYVNREMFIDFDSEFFHTDTSDITEYIITANDLEKQEAVKNGIKILKEAYPDYECRNLMIRILSDADYERYLDFEEGLLEFVNSLPAYTGNEKNPAEELMFGDPDRLEIKSQLREYKQIYPELSYSEIYDEYLSDWEDTSVYTRERKIYKLTVDRHNGRFSRAVSQMEEEEQEEAISENKKANIKPAVFGSVILVIGVVIVMMKKAGS